MKISIPTILATTISAGVIGATVIFAGIAQAGGGEDSSVTPPPPPWMNQDGTVDVTQIPAEVPLLDSNGEVCGYVSRDELLRGEVFQAAPESDTELEVAELKRQIVDVDGVVTEYVETPPVGQLC
jgi:hypothetical protein